MTALGYNNAPDTNLNLSEIFREKPNEKNSILDGLRKDCLRKNKLPERDVYLFLVPQKHKEHKISL